MENKKMKVTFEIDTIEEPERYENLVKADEYHDCLFDIYNQLRSWYKHGPEKTGEEVIEYVMEAIAETGIL